MSKEEGLSIVFAEVSAPEGLYQAVVRRIIMARRRAARFRLSALCIVIITSGMALVPILQYTLEELYSSGFYDYLSLMLSDRTFVVSSWREFSYSLAESFPSLAILLLTLCVTALCWSLWRAVRNAQVAFQSPASIVNA